MLGAKSTHLSGMVFYAAGLILFLFNAVVPSQHVLPETSSIAETELIASRLEAKVAAMLERHEAALGKRTGQTRASPARSIGNFTELRTVEVTSTSHGYWLLEPMLMIAVDHLGGGDLRAKFSDRYERMRIAQSTDVQVNGRKCVLMLVESVKGKAVFQFGCERGQTERLASARK